MKQLVLYRSVQYIFNRHMERRSFGRQITNLPDLKPRKTPSLTLADQPTRPSLVHKPISLQPLNKSITPRACQKTTIELQLKDPQMVPEYFRENLEYLRKQENEACMTGNYMSKLKIISEQDRAKLIDWLCKLHYKFKMFPGTLFTIVSFVDQYLAANELPLSELQLLGISALFAAAKFEETYQVPPLKQLVSCCAYQYTAQQILQKETQIIRLLDFKLISNSVFRFFEPYSTVIGLELKNYHLAQYILQLSLLQPRFLNYQPSLLAVSVIYLIKKIRKSETIWSAQITELVGYEEKQLKSCAKDLCCLLESAPDLANSRSIKEKFSLPSFHEVTRIKLERKERK